jgi:hypothetical protein
VTNLDRLGYAVWDAVHRITGGCGDAEDRTRRRGVGCRDGACRKRGLVLERVRFPPARGDESGQEDGKGRAKEHGRGPAAA